MDFIFFRDQIYKCSSFFFFTKVGDAVKLSMVFHHFIDYMPSLPTKLIDFIKCVPCHIVTFQSKLFVQTKSPWFVFHKKHCVLQSFVKISNFLECLFDISFIHFGINFVPKDNTWMVAILGLNDFEILWTPTGITWF